MTRTSVCDVCFAGHSGVSTARFAKDVWQSTTSRLLLPQASMCMLTSYSHCPWVFNCVGVNNHRQFFIYLLSLEAGVSLIVWITFECRDNLLRFRI
jgi:hypothetical protein